MILVSADKVFSVRQIVHRFDEAWRTPILCYLILRFVFLAWSWFWLAFSPVVVQNLVLFGEPLLTVFNLQNNERFVFDRRVGEQLLTFRAVESNSLIDVETGSIWDMSGRCVSGAFKGKQLQRAFYPESSIFPYFRVKPYPFPLLAIWQRFDVNWYLSIAEYGYGAIPDDIHFPPLYPLLIRAGRFLIGDFFLSAMLIAAFGSVYALKLMYEMFREWEESLGVKSLAYFLLFPTSFFLFSAYTEGLFIVTVILSIREMQTTRWSRAGWWIFCAVLLRLQGVALFLPLFYRMWQERRALRWRNAWFSLSVGGCSVLLYLFMRSRLTPAEAFPLAESGLHARLVFPWMNFIYAFQAVFRQFLLIDFLNLVVSLLFLGLIVWGWKKIPTEYNLYMAATMLILTVRYVETQPLNSMARYVLTLFPAFFTLATIGQKPLWNRVIIYSSIALLFYLSAQFFLWGWVG